MKKIISIFGLILFSVFIFGGCSLFGSPNTDIVKITFHVSEDGYDGLDFQGSELVVVPNYEERMLDVTYTEEVGGEINSGIVGGDFFDRFEEVVEAFEFDDGSGGVSSKAKVEGHSNFVAVIEKKDGDMPMYELGWMDELDEVEVIESFYADLAALFTEDVY